MKRINEAIINLANRFGYQLKKLNKNELLKSHYINIYRAVKDYSQTNKARIVSLIDAVEYIINNQIEGDFVECGVWKGGSVMAMALTLLHNTELNRDIYLFDTFTGMSTPSKFDISVDGESAFEQYEQRKKANERTIWNDVPINEVKNNVLTTGYPEDKFIFVKGKVEDTIPETIPNKIALLRLDTDYYESTMHELIYLFPQVVNKGVIIIDDYDSWLGSRKAVDEYIRKNKLCILLNRIENTGRIAIKTF